MSVSSAGLGLMATAAMLGAVLAMVTIFEVTAAPSSSPSFGVTMQRTSSLWSKEAPVSVLLMAPMSTLFTVQV